VAQPRRVYRLPRTIASTVILVRSAHAQATAGTGQYQGTVTDSTGAVVTGAKITITDRATGKTIKTTTNDSGEYSSGTLLPSEYTVRIEAAGFKSAEIAVVVQVGNAANGSRSLELGQGSEVVEVAASGLQVNTKQATVQMSRDILPRRLDADTFLSRHSAQPFEGALVIEWSCSGDVVSCFVSSHETVRSFFSPVVPYPCLRRRHSFLKHQA
jgi:hypothetical protein